MFEWLFCPQHGLFRPENFWLVVMYGNYAYQQVVFRFMILFGRYL